MQKKVLACLLVTPVAATALANVNIEGSKFPADAAQSVSGTDEGFRFNFNADGEGLVAPIGAGIVKFKTIENLCPGTYSVTITNAKNLKVTANGKSVDIVAGDGTLEFELKANTDVTVEMSAIDLEKDFGCTGASLEILINESEMNAALQGLLNDVPGIAILREDVTDDVLKALSATLTTDKGNIEGNIAKITAPLSYDDYANFELWKGANDCTIGQAIAKFKTAVEEFNTKADAANAEAEKLANHELAYIRLTNLAQGFENSLKEVKEKAEAADKDAPEIQKDFVQKTISADVKAFEAKITTLKNAIEAANKEGNLGIVDNDITGFTFPEGTDYNAMSADLKALKAACDAAIANKTAWNEYQKAIAELTADYDQTYTSVNALQDVDNKEGDVFGVKRAECLQKITDVLNKNNNSDGALELGAPADKINTAKDKTVAAKTEIQNLYDTFKALVDAQNKAYTDAQTAATKYQEEITAATADVKVPASEKENYDALVNAANTALATFNKYVDDQYAANTLPGEEYTAKEQAVKDAIEALTTAIEGYAPILNLETALQTEIDKVKKISDALNKWNTDNKTELTYGLYAKFEGQISGLYDAIGALVPGTSTDAEVKAVTAAIESLTATATILSKAYQDAATSYLKFKTDLEAYETFIKNKLIIEGADYDKSDAKTGMDKLEALRVSYSTEFANANNLEAQLSYNAIVALKEEIDQTGDESWGAQLAAAKTAFATDATAANLTYVQGLVGEAAKLIEDNKEVGKLAEKAPLAALQTALTTAKGNVTAAGEDFVKLGACDTELNELAGDCAKFTGDVNAYIAFINQLKGIPEKITSADEANQKTLDPAKTYFDALVDPETGKYITDYNNLLSALDKALSEGNLKDGMSGEEGFTARANALKTAVDGVEEIIVTNQEAYNELLAKSKNVMTHIDEVIAYVEANCKNDDARTRNLEALNALKATDLANVDVAMTGDFGKGALNDAKKTDYITKYDAIKAQADKIQSDFKDGVNNLNAATSQGWENQIAALRTLKDNAVKAYNAFFYDIKNAGYRAFINADLLNHSYLYSYTQKITTLEGKIQKYIDDSNAADFAFSAADFKKEATDEIDKLKTEITNAQEGLINNMNTLGSTYWTDQSEYRDGVYATLVQSMTAAGMFETDENGVVVYDEKTGAPVLNATLFGKCPELQEAINSHFTANTQHQAVVDLANQDPKPENYGYKDQIGFAMDKIADTLDKVVYDEKALESAADILWNAIYKEFSDNAATSLASVETDEAYSFATKEQKKDAKDKIDEQIDTAAGYNTEITAEDANTLSALQDGAAAELDKISEEIKNILDTLKGQSEANAKSDELYKEYTGEDGIIPNLKTGLQELIDYAASLAADSAPETVSAIAVAQTAVKALETFVEENKGSLSENGPSTRAEGLKGDADTAIADAYTAIRKAETAQLNSIMTDVREAFNNAKAETSWSQSNAAEMQKKIDEAINAIAGLKDLTNEKFQTTAQTLENNLCDYLAELEAVYTHDGTNTSAVDAQARLAAQYEVVEEALNAAKTELANSETSVQEEFADAYSQIEADLAAVNQKLETAGNKIVALESNYAADMDAIQKAIDSKKAEIEAANKAALEQKAIAENAVVLQNEIDGLTQKLEEIRTYLSTYQLDKPEQLGGDITMIEHQIASLQSTLDTMIEDKTLTADTTIDTTNIESQLTSLDYNGHIAAVEYVAGLANTAITDAENNLSRAHLLSETRSELQGQLNTVKVSKDQALQDFVDAISAYESSERTDANLATFFEAAETAITSLTAIESQARTVSEGVYDNEFTPGDVDLEPNGEVTVADVQQVIVWVGEGVTYKDLVETSPRQAYAADVNNDKTINIADVVAILNIAIDDLNNPSQAPRLLAKGIQQATDNHMAVALNGTENGIREYAVLVSNTTSFVAGQLDIKVGAGMEIVDIELSNRAADHELQRFDNSNGARVVIASMTNAELQGNDGALLIIRTRGAGNLEVEGAVFADSNATAYEVKNTGLSGIDSITEGCHNVKDRIYDAAGRAYNKLQRGINIIRHADGTTTKEMH